MYACFIPSYFCIYLSTPLPVHCHVIFIIRNDQRELLQPAQTDLIILLTSQKEGISNKVCTPTLVLEYSVGWIVDGLWMDCRRTFYIILHFIIYTKVCFLLVVRLSRIRALHVRGSYTSLKWEGVI